jgi:hypothetical protein
MAIYGQNYNYYSKYPKNLQWKKGNFQSSIQSTNQPINQSINLPTLDVSMSAIKQADSLPRFFLSGMESLSFALRPYLVIELLSY